MTILRKAFACACCLTFSVMLVASIGCQTRKEPTEAEIEEALEEFSEALEEAVKEMEDMDFDE